MGITLNCIRVKRMIVLNFKYPNIKPIKSTQQLKEWKAFISKISKCLKCLSYTENC